MRDFVVCSLGHVHVVLVCVLVAEPQEVLVVVSSCAVEEHVNGVSSGYTIVPVSILAMARDARNVTVGGADKPCNVSLK